MFTDQRDDLLRRNKKCDRVNETEQSQNDKTGESIFISAGKNLSQTISVIVHLSNANKVPGGRIELPANPESFRGCSTSPDNK